VLASLFIFFTYLITFIFTISYYKYHKKNLCKIEKIDGLELESCILTCTTFNYFYNFVILLIWTFVLNILCKFGSYIGSGIAFLLYFFSLIPLWYIIKLINDKSAKQKDLKC
jgi:hypothetical protein